MIVEAKCLCGQKVRIDTSKSEAKATCPMCARTVAVPPPPKPKAPEPVSTEDQLAGLSQPVQSTAAGYEEYEDKTRPNLIAGAAIGIVVLLVLVGFAIKYAVDSATHSSSYSSAGSGLPSGPITFGDTDSNGHGTGSSGNGTGSGTSGTGTGAGDHGTGSGSKEMEGNGNTSMPSADSGAGDAPAVADAPAPDPSQNAKNNLPEDGINVPGITNSTGRKHGPGGGIGLRGLAGASSRRRNGATTGVDAAVRAGLTWLASAQESDGSWQCQKWDAAESFDLGVTGLATLAFLGDGHYPGSKTMFETQTTKALDWIIAKQDDKTGRFAYKKFYEQAIGTICLAEAFALSKDDKYKAPAQAGVNYVISCIGPQGGFGYDGAGTDTSVTGFGIMAIKSSIMAQLDVPEDTIDKVKAYLNVATNDDGTTGYSLNSGARPSMTAAGLFCRIFLKYGLDDPKTAKASQLIQKIGVNVKDEYYNYYATYSMFQVGGGVWNKYNSEFIDALIKLQTKAPQKLRGSFPPADSQGGKAAGRVYATSMYLLSLEVYSRYLPLYREE